MDRIPLPTKIDYQLTEKPNEWIVSIEPLFPGYGNTIGTALRRVLLSSLVGGAVTAVKIRGVSHEFSTIPYVQEDVVDIILNLKKVRFRVHTDETVRVVLRAKGEKVVTALDIEGNADAEVVSPDVAICTLTNKNAQLEMELLVRRGRGYLPTENREHLKEEIGTIAIDALFTPVRNVGLRTENVRVGQMTNYDKVILTIATDGSVDAKEAMHAAADVLVDHFSFLHEKPPVESEDDSGLSHKEFHEALESGEEGETGEDEEKKEVKKRGRPRKNPIA